VPPLYQHDPFLFVQHLLWCDSAFTDVVWMGATVACEGWAVTLIALLFVYWRTRRLRGLVRATLPFFAALLLAGLFAQVLKEVVRTPRPLSVLDPGTVHVLLDPLRGTRSFPSGHSASAGALATYGLLRYRCSAWPLLLLAVLGGLSRIMVGAHWTVDVLGGLALGAFAAAIVWLVEGHLSRRVSAPRPPGPVQAA